MSLKKFLKTNSQLTAHNSQLTTLTGQASLEFFILFAVVTVMTIVSISSFFTTTKTNTEGLFQKAVGVDGINMGNK